MKHCTIAFDIDGTLRCTCEPTCRNANVDIASLARTLAGFKNVKLIAWTGTTKEYCLAMIRDMGLDDVFKPSKCFQKLEYIRTHEAPDIAIDDIQDFNLGKVNLIVREK